MLLNLSSSESTLSSVASFRATHQISPLKKIVVLEIWPHWHKVILQTAINYKFKCDYKTVVPQESIQYKLSCCVKSFGTIIVTVVYTALTGFYQIKAIQPFTDLQYNSCLRRRGQRPSELMKLDKSNPSYSSSAGKSSSP